MTLAAISDMKFIPCAVCGGPENVVGGPLPRRILHFADRVEVRCNNLRCGDVVVYRKKKLNA